MVALSRPFMDDQNMTLAFAGGVMALTGIFIRGRIRRGLPIFKATYQEQIKLKAELAEARREFSFRRILGQLLGTFGAIIQVAGMISLIRGDSSSKTNWPLFAGMFGFGLLLIFCAAQLMKRRSEDA